jgi:predicted esterase
MISKNIIQTSKTARYYTLGEASPKIDKVWFVFHGYGQLAKEFLNDFRVIENETNLIVAPEALNKFYLRGFNGKIGATWMTKEARENEIDDYVKMINNVYNKIAETIDLSKVQFNIFGFSQGTHTAVRWLDRSKLKVDNLILWSGSFPHDCNYKDNAVYWSKIKTKIVLGKNDRFVDQNKLKEETEYLNRLSFLINLIFFEGSHEIIDAQLLKISNTI